MELTELMEVMGLTGLMDSMETNETNGTNEINGINGTSGTNGTNEINRLLAVDALLKRGMKNEFNLFEKARHVSDRPEWVENVSGPGYDEVKAALVRNLKNAILMLIPGISEAFGRKLADEEEVLEECRLALMQTGRKAGVYIAHKRRETHRGRGTFERSNVHTFERINDRITQHVMATLLAPDMVELGQALNANGAVTHR